MKCTHPIIVKYGKVPCGKCMACRLNKQKDWTDRLMHESIYWNDKCFVTLTYDDLYLPINMSLKKRDLQLFIKSIRYDNNKEIKYYAAGEYGDKSKRPHYHIIFFGLGIKFDFNKYWKNGFIKVGVCNEKTIRYTSKYILKKLLGKVEISYYKDRGIEKEFSLMSKNIGLKWLLDNKDMLIRDLGIRRHGSVARMPRYYFKKLVELGLLDKDVFDKYFWDNIDKEWKEIAEMKLEDDNNIINNILEHDKLVLDRNKQRDIDLNKRLKR